MPTTEFFPDPSTGATTVDGVVGREGVNEIFGTLRAGAGNGHNDTGANTNFVALNASTTIDQYEGINRFIMTFDTSILGGGAIIDSTNLSLERVGKFNGLSGETHDNSRMVVVASTPATDNDLVNADYGQTGSISFGEFDTQVNIGVGYETATLNADGRTNISKTGISKFAVRYKWDFGNTLTGLTWSSGGSMRLDGYTADLGGTNSDPRLIVVTPDVGPANLKTLDTVAIANIKTIDGVAIGNIKTWNTVS